MQGPRTSRCEAKRDQVDWPRMFLVDEQNEVVLVANQNSGNIVIFALEADGTIGDTLIEVALDTPTAIAAIR